MNFVLKLVKNCIFALTKCMSSYFINLNKYKSPSNCSELEYNRTKNLLQDLCAMNFN